MLFDKTMDEAKMHDCTKVTLSATDEGRALYVGFGFEDVADEMVFYFE